MSMASKRGTPRGSVGKDMATKKARKDMAPEPIRIEETWGHIVPSPDRDDEDQATLTLVHVRSIHICTDTHKHTHTHAAHDTPTPTMRVRGANIGPHPYRIRLIARGGAMCTMHRSSSIIGSGCTMSLVSIGRVSLAVPNTSRPSRIAIHIITWQHTP